MNGKTKFLKSVQSTQNAGERPTHGTHEITEKTSQQHFGANTTE
jgi:hypothetical protein